VLARTLTQKLIAGKNFLGDLLLSLLYSGYAQLLVGRRDPQGGGVRRQGRGASQPIYRAYPGFAIERPLEANDPNAGQHLTDGAPNLPQARSPTSPSRRPLRRLTKRGARRSDAAAPAKPTRSEGTEIAARVAGEDGKGLKSRHYRGRQCVLGEATTERRDVVGLGIVFDGDAEIVHCSSHGLTRMRAAQHGATRV
jgi:hypothetical protein